MLEELEKNRWLSLLLVILITIEIFWFSTLTGTGTATGGSNWPARIYHMVAFFLFAFFFFTFIKGQKEIKPWHVMIVLIISMIHAVLDEFHQSFTLGRDSSFRDIFTDTIGIFTAIIIYIWARRKRKTNKSNNKVG
ncbi:VanZ family protein [Candidatus Pacearchaeota archaeon]|nr:VanZ family protein [Candidatus Pacearchaeota archaeon]